MTRSSARRPTPHATIRELQDRLRGWESAPGQRAKVLVSGGSSALDGWLPEGGLHRGTLVEWLEDGPGQGAGALALAAAREACRQGAALVVVDDPQSECRFYPPAAAALGIDLERTLIVRPAGAADAAWAVSQALASRSVGAVLCWTVVRAARDWRRWQLAAERGGSLGLFVRPSRAQAEPCFSALRLLVRRCEGRTRVTLLRSRWGVAGATVQWDLDDEPSAVRMAAQLAGAAPAGRPAGTA